MEIPIEDEMEIPIEDEVVGSYQYRRRQLRIAIEHTINDIRRFSNYNEYKLPRCYHTPYPNIKQLKRTKFVYDRIARRMLKEYERTTRQRHKDNRRLQNMFRKLLPSPTHSDIHELVEYLITICESGSVNRSFTWRTRRHEQPITVTISPNTLIIVRDINNVTREVMYHYDESTDNRWLSIMHLEEILTTNQIYRILKWAYNLKKYLDQS